MPLFISRRPNDSRMYLIIKLLIFFSFLTVIYHYSQGSQSEYDFYEFSYVNSVKNKDKFAPFNDIVGIASSNVAAYSNGNDSYLSNENNYLFGVYMGIKWQCVEYARRWTFLRKGATFESVVGANDMWTQLINIQRVIDGKLFPLKQHSNGSPNLPLNNSYLIYPIQKDMPFGHVAVIVDVQSNVIRIAEQNFYFFYWIDNYAREIPIVKKNNLYYIQDTYDVYGWMEIIDNEYQLKPLDQAIIRKYQMTIESSSLSCFHQNIHIFYCLIFLILFVSHLIYC